ncbi:MAG: hypothetical protein ACLRVE_07385 [Finegoldia magna]
MLNTHENNIKAEKMLEEYYKKYLEKKKKSKKSKKIKPKKTK